MAAVENRSSTRARAAWGSSWSSRFSLDLHAQLDRPSGLSGSLDRQVGGFLVADPSEEGDVVVLVRPERVEVEGMPFGTVPAQRSPSGAWRRWLSEIATNQSLRASSEYRRLAGSVKGPWSVWTTRRWELKAPMLGPTTPEWSWMMSNSCACS